MVEMKSRISWTSSSRPVAIKSRAMAWAANSDALATRISVSVEGLDCERDHELIGGESGSLGGAFDLAQEAKRLRRNQKPGVPWRIVVMIDELDRCRPDYAVRFLETVKHIFEVDHVAFVIAMNREQLVESVRDVYGAGFDAENYLERFGDVRLRLAKRSLMQFRA